MRGTDCLASALTSPGHRPRGGDRAQEGAGSAGARWSRLRLYPSGTRRPGCAGAAVRVIERAVAKRLWRVVKVTLLFEDGSSIDKTFAVTATSRFNVSVREEFPAALNKRFGALIESQGPTPAQLVVERSVYSNAVGQQGRARAEFWAAGTNALATRLQ